MAYQLKTIRYKDTTRRILLQNINGPCPLLAAANALLLKGVISLSGECVRSGVASTDDVVNMLAGWAIERASTNTSSDNEYHLNEVLSLLPSLQHGMDVNPKFNSPTGVEYTNNLAAFDSLGIELVHGWLVDPVEAVAVLIQDKSYNELIEFVIGGNEAKDEIEKLSDTLAKLEEKMAVAEVKQSEICASTDDQEEAVANVQHSTPESEKAAAIDDTRENSTLVSDKEHSANTKDNASTNISSVNDPSSSEQEKSTDKDDFINKDSCKNAATIDEIKITNTLDRKECTQDSETTDLSTEDAKVQTLISIQNNMADIRQRISALSEIMFKSQTINDFLSESSHQLTYHGLERLHKYLSEDGLSVFFRNNHFATITKHSNTLYLLVTDLGYANTPDIVWEKLDTIDGDTEYTNESFCRPKVREDLTPAPGPTINPELMLAQRSQAESDYALALALSEGRATSERMDDDESKLIAAATEASLKTYHGEDGTVAVDENNAENTNQNSQVDADREIALAFQKEHEKIDHESEQLARQLQEMEYAQHQQPPAAGAPRNNRSTRPASSSRKNPAATEKCIVS